MLVVALKANLGLPSSKICLSRRKFIAHPRAPKGRETDPRRSVHQRQAQERGALTKRHTTINLIGLPKGTFKVAMLVTASNGKKYEDMRTFHTCVPGHHTEEIGPAGRGRSTERPPPPLTTPALSRT